MATPLEYNLLGLQKETIQDPYPFYRLLQAEAPVFKEPEYGVYLVTRYADILDVIRQPLRFSSRMPTGPNPRPRLDELAPELRRIVIKMIEGGELVLPTANAASQSTAVSTPTLLAADPPAHERYRGMCSALLNNRTAKAWEPRIRQIADDLIDAFIDRSQVEFVVEFAHPLPLMVVGELLGVPRSDHALLETLFGGPNVGETIGNANVMLTRMANALKAGSPGSRGAGSGQGDPFTTYFSRRISELRRKPVEGDFLSDLIRARDDDGVALTDEELLSIVRHFRVAGHETSTKMMTAAMYYLISHPEVMAAVRSDPSLCENLVEEALRIEAPVQGLFRIANEDCVVGGVNIPSGSMLMMLYGAANHDPDQHSEPERFDLTRPNSRAHLAFGQGPHYCLGAPFARAEGRIGFETLLSRTSDIEFTDGRNNFERTSSFVLRGLKELHLTITPAG